jgi:hypothetical protein
MSALLQLATAGNTVPTPDADGYVDLTSVTAKDWVRIGGKAHKMCNMSLVIFGVNWIDQLLEWQHTGHYPAGHASRQGPRVSEYNVQLVILPQNWLNIGFYFRGLPVQVQDNLQDNLWRKDYQPELNRVPTRAARKDLMKLKLRFPARCSRGKAWRALLDRYFRLLQEAMDKLVIERDDLMDQETGRVGLPKILRCGAPLFGPRAFFLLPSVLTIV